MCSLAYMVIITKLKEVIPVSNLADDFLPYCSGGYPLPLQKHVKETFVLESKPFAGSVATIFHRYNMSCDLYIHLDQF